MKNTKKFMDIMHIFISNIKDEDLEKLINGEVELTLKEIDIKKDKSKKIEKSKLKNKEVDLKSDKIQDIYNKIRECSNREEAKGILVDCRFTKAKLLEFGEILKVNLPKSATKDKIIEKIVDIAVGWSLDRSSISEVKLK